LSRNISDALKTMLED